MTKLLTLVTLVGSLLVAGVASAAPAPRADVRAPSVDHRSARDDRNDGAGPRRERMARDDGDRTDQPRQLRAGDGGCVGKRHGKQLEKGKRTGKRMNKRGPGDRHSAPDRGRRGPRQDQPDRRDA
jgi:hypothetical protein